MHYKFSSHIIEDAKHHRPCRPATAPRPAAATCAIIPDLAIMSARPCVEHYCRQGGLQEAGSTRTGNTCVDKKCVGNTRVGKKCDLKLNVCGIVKKAVDFFVMCDFCINTHTFASRINLINPILIYKGGKLFFFKGFPSFSCFIPGVVAMQSKKHF